jgi:hypothetical protein
MDNELLSEFDLSFPDDLLQIEIERQLMFAEPVHTFTKNFLEIFHKKQMLKNESRESTDDDTDPEALEHNALETDNCYRSVIYNLKHRCGVLIDTGTGEYDPNVIDTIYSTFIYRIHTNVREFIVASININKQMFADQFESGIGNNISMKLARKTFKNKVDAVIAVQYRTIIDMILSDDGIMHPENFISVLYRNHPDDYEYRMIIQLYNTVYISFNVPLFCQYIRNIYTNISALESLKADVLSWLLPSFPLKTQEETV